MFTIADLSWTILSGIFFFVAQAILSSKTLDDTTERCRLGRLALRLSQARFAALCGVNVWTYGAFERKTGKLTYDEQKLVAAVLMAKLGGNVRSYFPGFVPKSQADEDLINNRDQDGQC